MSCHYSCLTCTSNIYENLCLTCPTNRYLLDSQCFCSSGFYQDLTAQCATSLSYFQTVWEGVQIGLYYWMIFIFWMSVIFSLSHIYSPKARILINFGQLIALLNQYRYRFSYISQKCLDVFGTLNFSYLNNIFCSKKSRPYGCESYQNIFGPLLIMSMFIIMYILSYLITKGCIWSVINGEGSNQIIIRAKSKKNIQEGNSLSLFQYFQMSFSSFFLLFLDYAIVSITVQLFKIVQINYLTFTIIIPITIIIIAYIVFHLNKINSQRQFNIGYRSQYGYFYLYDQNYHLNYIDYLFYQQKMTKQFLYKPKRFYPNSNFLIIQIGFKFLISLFTILLFEFKPQLIVYPLMAFLLVVFYCMQIFQIYQRLCLLLYLICSGAYLLSVSVFHFDQFFQVYILCSTFFFSFFASLFIIVSLSSWNRSKQGKYLKKAFQSLASNEEGSQLDKPQVENIELQPLSMQESQQDLVPANKTKLSKFNASHTLYTKKVSSKSFGLSNNKINTQSSNPLISVKNSIQGMQGTKKNSQNKFGISQYVKQKSMQRSNNIYNQESNLENQKQTLYSKMSKRNKAQKQPEMFVLQQQEENQSSAQDSEKPFQLENVQRKSQKDTSKRTKFDVKSKISSRKMKSQISEQIERDERVQNIFQKTNSKLSKQNKSQKKFIPQISQLIRQQQQDEQNQQ